MVKPKKHFGQHFLTDENIARKIVNLLAPQPDEKVLEIGPGKGVLTTLLLEKNFTVTGIDIDKEAVAHLRLHFNHPRLTIVEADFLDYSLPQENYTLIGNLPYNISSPIFFKILEHHEQFRQVACMIQKEVAERIAAKPGSKTYGILSVLLGYYYTVRYEFKVPPSVFFPRPNVDSAVISMVRKEKTTNISFHDFRLLVKKAFGQRRKMLKNALAELDFLVPEKYTSKRAEQLSIEDFVELLACWQRAKQEKSNSST